MKTGQAIAMLRNLGYIVLDSRMVIAAHEEYVRKPSDLIAGGSDKEALPGGYVPPNILGGQIPHANAK